MPKDYYAVLGVEKSADPEQIKKAYREKAKEVHPDVNPNPESETIFQTLSEAYMVLSDPNKRSAYDAGNVMPVLSHSEVTEILRKRGKFKRGVFEAWLVGELANHYPPTNYKTSEPGSMKINKFILVIAIIFLIDLSFSRKPETTEVTNLVELYLRTGNINDIGSSIVITKDIEFTLTADKTQLSIGDTFLIQKSLIFGELNTVKMASDLKFHHLGNRRFTMGIGLFVFLVSVLGLTSILSPERKFNAAIIAGFFAAILILTLFFT